MKKISPYLIIVASFFTLIVIGAVLLFLPIATKEGNSLTFIDAFFISTSAVTITGLSSVSDLSVVLTLFGKIVLALLIQIGGLSVVCFSVFIMYLIGANIGISNRVLIKETFNQNDLSGMVRLVIKIVIYTFIVEFISFSLNLLVFINSYEPLKAIGISAFHAISAFNNAGFDLLGSTSLEQLNTNVLLNINTALTIMIGGIGFIVVNDIYENKSYKKLTTHTKIVLKMNLFLWIFGTVIFKFTEKGNSASWLEAFFLSVTARTAGFTTVNISLISSATTLLLMFLMFTGGSPASTAGGVKTTTIYTLFKDVTSYAKGKQLVTNKRLIDKTSKEKASILITSALVLVNVVAFGILIFENTTLDKALFESISAFSNVGLTKGLTTTLKNESKILLIFLMITGRVGVLTMLKLFNNKWYKKDFHHLEYIEEKIMIG